MNIYHERCFSDAKFDFHPTVEINEDVYIDYSGDVMLEKDVSLGQGVIIETHSHHMENANWKEIKKITKHPLLIKEGAFIGIRAIILPSCTQIGKYSVVGAGSVVTKNIPDYEIWAGNPAKFIRSVNHE